MPRQLRRSALNLTWAKGSIIIYLIFLEDYKIYVILDKYPSLQRSVKIFYLFNRLNSLNLIDFQRMLCSRVMAGLMVRGGRRCLATSANKTASYSVQDEEDFKARVLASQVHKR